MKINLGKCIRCGTMSFQEKFGLGKRCTLATYEQFDSPTSGPCDGDIIPIGRIEVLVEESNDGVAQDGLSLCPKHLIMLRDNITAFLHEHKIDV